MHRKNKPMGVHRLPAEFWAPLSAPPSPAFPVLFLCILIRQYSRACQGNIRHYFAFKISDIYENVMCINLHIAVLFVRRRVLMLEALVLAATGYPAGLIVTLITALIVTHYCWGTFRIFLLMLPNSSRLLSSSLPVGSVSTGVSAAEGAGNPWFSRLLPSIFWQILMWGLSLGTIKFHII